MVQANHKYSALNEVADWEGLSGSEGQIQVQGLGMEGRCSAAG